VESTKSSIERLEDELRFAREKFPANSLLVEALCEELGEAARDPGLHTPGCYEWLQVACVAMRLYDEGCPDATKSRLLGALKILERRARKVLE